MPGPAVLMLGSSKTSGPERVWPKTQQVRLLGARFCRTHRSKGAGAVSREEEGERRAFARRALHPYLAAVGLGDLAGYGQPQARAALRAGGISPVEALVDEGQLILGDPNPRIRDRQRHAAVFLLHSHLHAPPVWCLLDRVVKENGSHLHYPLPIEGGSNFVLVWYELHGHLAVISSLGSLLGYRTEIVTSYLHGCALIPPGQREQGLDQATHPTCLPADGVDAPMGGLLICIEGPLVEHPGVPAYGGEGGSQLVACVGGEAPLAREGLFEAAEGHFQARQKRVYGGGETSDFVFRVGDGQAPREIPFRHLAGGSYDRLHRGEGGSGQEVRPAHQQRETQETDGGQNRGEILQDTPDGGVALARLYHPCRRRDGRRELDLGASLLELSLEIIGGIRGEARLDGGVLGVELRRLIHERLSLFPALQILTMRSLADHFGNLVLLIPRRLEHDIECRIGLDPHGVDVVIRALGGAFRRAVVGLTAFEHFFPDGVVDLSRLLKVRFLRRLRFLTENLTLSVPQDDDDGTVLSERLQFVLVRAKEVLAILKTFGGRLALTFGGVHDLGNEIGAP